MGSAQPATEEVQSRRLDWPADGAWGSEEPGRQTVSYCPRSASVATSRSLTSSNEASYVDHLLDLELGARRAAQTLLRRRAHLQPDRARDRGHAQFRDRQDEPDGAVAPARPAWGADATRRQARASETGKLAKAHRHRATQDAARRVSASTARGDTDPQWARLHAARAQARAMPLANQRARRGELLLLRQRGVRRLFLLRGPRAHRLSGRPRCISAAELGRMRPPLALVVPARAGTRLPKLFLWRHARTVLLATGSPLPRGRQCEKSIAEVPQMSQV